MILDLYKRGCDFLPGKVSSDTIDIGNYRVYLEYVNKDGKLVYGDAMGSSVNSKRGRPEVLQLHFQLCTQSGDHHIGYAIKTKQIFFGEYTIANLLKTINADSRDVYTSVRFQPLGSCPDHLPIRKE